MEFFYYETCFCYHAFSINFTQLMIIMCINTILIMQAKGGSCIVGIREHSHTGYAM